MKNGFVRYVEFRRTQVLAGNHDLSGGRALWEFVYHCRDEWQTLSEEDKDQFRLEAQLTFSDRQEQNRKLSHQDNSVVVNKIPLVIGPRQEDDTALSNQDIVLKMFQDPEAWMSKPITICNFTLYANPGRDLIYLPAEVGLTAMTLKDGVIDNYARIINPKTIPRGYVKEFMDSIENLSLPSVLQLKPLEHEPFMLPLKSFLEKYNPEGGTLYVFAFDSDLKTVQESFKWLFNKYGFSFPVRVLSLGFYSYLASTKCSKTPQTCTDPTERRTGQISLNSCLVVSTHREKGKPLVPSFIYPASQPLCRYGMFVSDSEVESAIKLGDNFKNQPELCCVYHMKRRENIEHCALHMSNRYAFSLLEILTLSNDVPLLPGGHYPEVEEPQTEQYRRYQWLLKWGLTSLEQEMDPGQETMEIDSDPRNGFSVGFKDSQNYVVALRSRRSAKRGRRSLRPLDNPFRPLPPSERPYLVRDGAGVANQHEVRRAGNRGQRPPPPLMRREEILQLRPLRGTRMSN